MKKLSIVLLVTVLAVLGIAQMKSPITIVAPTIKLTNGSPAAGQIPTFMADGTLWPSNAPSGGSGSVATNANQFGASPTLSIASGALLTNINIKAASGASLALTVDTNKLVVTNGNVGIGTATPIANLHIIDNNQTGMLLERTSATQRKFHTYISTAGKYNIYDGNSALDRLTIDTSGNVGIGTTTPTNMLDVTGNTSLRSNVVIFGTSVVLSALPTNATPIAILGVDAAGKVYEAENPASTISSRFIVFATGTSLAGTNIFTFSHTNGTVDLINFVSESGLKLDANSVRQSFDDKDLYFGVAAVTNAWKIHGNRGDGANAVFLGSWEPVLSNRFSLGAVTLPASNVWANDIYAKVSVNIQGAGSGKLAISDNVGTNFQFEGSPTMSTDVVYRLPKNATPGVMVAVVEAGKTNQMTNITLTAGQVLTHNGTTYVASNLPSLGADATRQQQIANVEQLSKYLLPVPVTFSNSWANYSGAAAGYKDVVALRNWDHAYFEGMASNSSPTAAAGTICFVPWGYRHDAGYPQGTLTYNNASLASSLNMWITADSRLNSAYAFAGLVSAALEVSFSSTAYYIAVKHPEHTNSCLLIPPNLTNATTLVVFFHGMGGNQFDFINSRDDAVSTDSNLIVTCKAFLTNGWPLLSNYGQGNSFGNAASLNDYSNAVMWATNSLIVTNVVFLDGSMGGLVGLQTFANLPSVSRIYNISPLASLSNAYYSGSATFSNAINTAFGTTAATFTADTASYDPYRLNTNLFGGRRVRFAVSAGDTIVATNLHSYLWTNKFYSASISVTNTTGEHGIAPQVIAADIINYFR